MTDIVFLGYFFQLCHNLLYVYMCFFIFETFKIKNTPSTGGNKFRMDLEDDSDKSGEDDDNIDK